MERIIRTQNQKEDNMRRLWPNVTGFEGGGKGPGVKESQQPLNITKDKWILSSSFQNGTKS